MKYRRKSTKIKYKTHNKLTVIMRQAKNEYHTKKLEGNKNNIKAILKNLNGDKE